MKIKLNSIYASPHHTAHPGSIMDVSDEEGAELVKGGFAAELKESAVDAAEATIESAQSPDASIESAAIEPSENAAGAKPKRRRG